MSTEIRMEIVQTIHERAAAATVCAHAIFTEVTGDATCSLYVDQLLAILESAGTAGILSSEHLAHALVTAMAVGRAVGAADYADMAEDIIDSLNR